MSDSLALFGYGPCQTRRMFSIALPMTLLVVAAGCSSADHPVTLEGEWAIEFAGERATGGHVRADGVLVFDTATRCYCNPHDLLPGVLIGRGYVDREALDSARRGVEKMFAPTIDGDEFEAMEGMMKNDSVFISLPPGPAGLRLRGWLHADSIRGGWVAESHTDTVLQGTFRMRRVPRSMYTDSAISRSRRALPDTMLTRIWGRR